MKFSAMNFPKIPIRKKKVKDFLLIEIGLEVVNMAKLSMEGEPKIVEVGRKSFPSLKDMFNASLEAIDDLAGKTSDIPNKAILGVSGGPIKTETTVAQYSRPEPNDPVDSREIENFIDVYTTSFGRLSVHVHRYVQQSADATGRVLSIRPEKLKISFLRRPFMDTTLQRAGDYDFRAIVGDLTLEVRNQDSNFFANGFDID